MTEHDRPMAAMQAALAADMLALGRSLDMWSMAFAVLAGAGLLIMAHGHDVMQSRILGAGLLLAVAQKYYALRTGLDAAIFRRWSEGWASSAESCVGEDLLAFDAELGNNTTTCRPLADRIRDARQLLLRQAFFCVAQVLCFLIAMCIS